MLNILCRCSNKQVSNDPKYVELLKKIDAKGDDVNSRPLNGVSCIHSAALNANLPAVKFLLDRCCFLNCVNR